MGCYWRHPALAFPSLGPSIRAWIRRWRRLSEALSDDGAFNVLGGSSIDGFTRAEADLALPTFARNRGRIALGGRYIDATNVQFFGVGNGSSKDNLTHFGYTPTGGGVRLDFGGKFVSFDGGVEILEIETSGGRTAPSVKDRFSPSGTPGLGVSTFDYVDGRAGVALDSESRFALGPGALAAFSSTTIESSTTISTRSSRWS